MASKNIVAKGTTYNGVESVTFPVSGGGNATFYEISDTTAGASDVLNSKYFYTSSGVKTQGTGTAPSPTLITKSITANGTYNASSDNADGYSSVTVSVSGGGGGLVYETGTWEPEEDVANYLITLQGSHSVAPYYYMISDQSGTYSGTLNSNHVVIYNNFHQLSGHGCQINNSNSTLYGLVNVIYRSSSDVALTGTAGIQITYPYTYLTANSNACSRYWATENTIRAYTNSTSRFFRAGRTYKWIAVWAPTT